jgi:transcription initiation factor TFIIIB Brf1 subunit/transcription initiation factor TFIIB
MWIIAMCRSVVYDPHAGMLICEDSGEVIEERLPEEIHPVYSVGCCNKASQGAPYIPDLGKLSREVFEVASRLRIPRYALYTAISIARYIETRTTIRKSRLHSYTAAVIKVSAKIHGLNIGIKDITRAMGISKKDLRHFIPCLSVAWWAADTIYKDIKKRQVHAQVEEERVLPIPA